MTEVPSNSLCVLFADATGNPVLRKKLGDAEAKRATQRCLNRIERATVAHRGRQIKTVVDQVLVVFDNAEEGFLAACDMQQKINELPPVSGHKFAISVGFCYGAAVEQQGHVFGDVVGRAARLVAQAKVGQAITCDHTVKQLPPSCLSQMRQLENANLKISAEVVPLWEVIWHGSEDFAQSPNFFASTQRMELKLRLRHGNNELFLGAQRRAITLGRDPNSDLVIADPHASRRHARIELRAETFVLIDHSTNGTYIKIEDDAESKQTLKHEETALHDRGRITFGHAFKEETSDFVDYFVVE